MALQKQKVVVNLAEGLDTKSDEKRLMVGKSLAMENAVYKKTGAISKRNGYVRISPETVDGMEIELGDSLAIFNDELLQYNNQTLYSYSSGSGKWVDKDDVVSAIVRSNTVISNTAVQTQADSAINNGIVLYAWEDSRGGVRASAYDDATGMPVWVDQVVDASGSRVRCLAFGDYIFVFYYKSGSLFVRRLNPVEPTSLDAAVEVYDDVNTTSPTYDVYNYDNIRLLWCANRQSSAGVRAGWLNDVPEVLAGVTPPVTVSTEAATNCLGIIRGPNQTFYIVYQNTTNGVRCTIRNNGLGEVHAAFTVENITGSNVVNVTGFTSGQEVTCFYEVEAAASYNQVVRQNTIDTDSSVGTPSDFLRSVGLYTKAFSYIGSDSVERFYVGLAYESTLQSTYFVARSDGLIIAKQQGQQGGGLTSRPILANVNNTSSGVYSYSLLKTVRLVSENGDIYTPTGVAKTSIDFTNEDIFQSVQIGNNLIIAGGVISMYDGHSVVEHGFHLFPENVTAVDAASGGSMSDGDYDVIVVYEWTDNYGQVHRSAPSIPISVNVNGGGSSQKITVTVPTLRLTRKDGTNRSNISLAIYRTIDGPGATFYRATSLSSLSYNDVTADTVDVDLTIDDTDLISNEILYTTGDVLDNLAPPAASSIAVFKNRVFLAGLEEPNQFWFSKEYKSGGSVEFNDTLVKSLEAFGGRVTALGVLDDKIILFKKDRFYFTYGDGPNNLGLGGDFAEPQFLSSDVGCVNQQSIVRTPVGLAFKSFKGIYLISNQLQINYIGADVEGFNDELVTSSALVQNDNQIRFTTLNGPILVFDYFHNKWSTFTGLSSKSSVVWNNSYVILRTLGDVLMEDSSIYKDAGTSYGLKVVTGWISFDGIGGYKRVYKALLVGEYKSSHKVRVKVFYDYSPGSEGEAIFDPDSILNITKYGEDSPYGAVVKYGGENSAYLFEIRPKRQKCGAIKFEIEELASSPSASNTQESLTLSDLSMVVGIKGGITRLKSGRNIGIRE